MAGPTKFVDFMPTAPTLQAFGVGFKQRSTRLVMSLVAPLFVPEVRSRKYKYRVLDTGNRLRIVDTRVGPYDPETSSYLRWTDLEGEWEERMHSVPLSSSSMPDMDDARAKEQATEQATEKVLLDWEQYGANYFGTIGNYASGYSLDLTAGTGWNTPGSTPLADIANALTLLDMRAEGAIIQATAPPLVWMDLALHANLQPYLVIPGNTKSENYQPGTGGISDATIQTIATKLGFDRGIRAAATYNSAIQGATDVFARLWGNHFIIQVIDPTPGPESSANAVTVTPYDDMFVNYEEEVDIRVTKYGCQAIGNLLIANQHAMYGIFNTRD